MYDKKIQEKIRGVRLIVRVSSYTGAKKYWHPYLINTIDMRSL